ncbi:MAG: hypothetical protein ACWA5L_05265 [bacterium]
MLRFITNPIILLLAIGVIIIANYIFIALTPQFSAGVFLDLVLSQDRLQNILAGMNSDERQLHLAATATIDMLYPLALFVFAAGMISRFGPPLPYNLAIWLPAIASGLDILENITILALLNDVPALIGIKTILTICKFSAYLLSAGLVIVSLLYAGVKIIRRN